MISDNDIGEVLDHETAYSAPIFVINETYQE